MNKQLFTLLAGTILSAFLTGCALTETKQIENLSDLKGLTVAVPRGTTHEAYMAGHTEADVRSFDSTMEAISALQLGRASAAVTNRAVATVAVRQDSTLFIVPLEMGKDPVAVAVGKGNVALRDSISKIILSLKKEGILDGMEARWLSAPEAYFPLAIDYPAEGTPLRVAVSANREPFCFKDASGTICGFDAELAGRIARSLNRPLVFVDMNFSALVTSLQAGRVDAIISLMNFTPERERVVDFTVPYFESERVMLQKK